MLRPASLLPALSQAFDAPLWPVGSLLSAGACYRVLWRLPGRDLHPREVRVFQDAPCLDVTGHALSDTVHHDDVRVQVSARRPWPARLKAQPLLRSAILAGGQDSSRRN